MQYVISSHNLSFDSSHQCYQF